MFLRKKDKSRKMCQNEIRAFLDKENMTSLYFDVLKQWINHQQVERVDIRSLQTGSVFQLL